MAPPSPSWSDIPLEVAGLFLRRLPTLVDRVRFAAVCPQWRAAAREEVPLPSPLPLLALPDGTVYSLPGSEPLRFSRCAGYADACGNWLAFKTEDGSFLRDPFSNATMTLPRLFRFRAPGRHGESETRVSWVEIEDATVKLSMWRLVFCSPQLIAAFVRFKDSTRLAVCQPGATWWSVHMDRWFQFFDDMTFHQGKLYVLTDVNNGCLFEIDIIVDHRTGDPWVSRVERVISGVVIPSPAITGVYQNLSLWTHYLVELESQGALLMVHRKTYGRTAMVPRGLKAFNFAPSGRVEFEVFRADFQQSKWTKVTTIGNDQVLFLRRRCSRFVCLSPEETTGDRIVFLEQDDSCRTWDSASDSCKVYDMRDGTISPFVPSVHWKCGVVRATWLFPPV